MFVNKLYNKAKSAVKGCRSCLKRGSMAVALFMAASVSTFAQNAAGDYSAGTTALSQVAEEIAKYIPIVVQLCYAIAGVVAILGAISVYIAMNTHLFNLVQRYLNPFSKPLEISAFEPIC